VTDFIATAEADIAAPAERVWRALTDPAEIREYMFGAEVITDWTVGGRIVWRGEYEGRAYEDKGQVVAYEPPRLLQVTHFSPLTGKPDVPENCHTVTYRLEQSDDRTHVVLTQDHNQSEEAADHSERNWAMVLRGLKEHVEANP
jgi:uncharacterized protein YndB with AHSA1/START domain